MKLRLALAAATCMALPIVANAQPVTGPYVSLGAGTSFQQPIDFRDNAVGVSGKLQTRPYYAGAMAVGYGFGNGLRIELGGVFDRNTVHKADFNGGFRARAHGGMNTYGPMVNVYYDFNAGLPIYPYLGGGVGYQWVNLDSHVNDGASLGTVFGGSRGSFAYDLIAGLAYPLAAVPGLSVTGEYRFTQLVQSRNYPVVGFPGGVEKLGQISSHTFLIGLRYQLFNAPAAVAAPAPAPAPVAAPAPAPAKTYLVFFDWDKAVLTPKATQIIAEAASDSKTQNVTTLDVSGYTDTSGTAVYNQGLSERRAKAVAGKLVADGVPASDIEIHAYGETHLLVPTGPNVREPQNRRVEIVLN
ncbi:OmpA family protein [Acidocella sp.]|uniref:OmpA family protein n=1 Tax=Acidocella sp. TaxID=50710 RepID=UPI00262A698C|nr:OmpA family protein [Acidocella sp.]